MAQASAAAVAHHGGLILDSIGYALVIEPGADVAAGLIWVLCLATTPASVIAIRALLFWTVRVER